MAAAAAAAAVRNPWFGVAADYIIGGMLLGLTIRELS